MRVIDADRLRNIAISNRDVEMVYEIDHSPTVERPHGEWEKESAIDYLIEIGWLPEHDRILTERPHGEWIPCSERLPKRDELVLVSYKTGGVHLCKYLDDGSENPWWSYIDDCCAWNNTVDAWMPLPEPYKEEGDRND